MWIRSVGIDLGKTTFHLVALGENGKVLLRKKFTQKQLASLDAACQRLRQIPGIGPLIATVR
jgi:transposase